MDSWYSTIVLRLNDIHGISLNKRFLITNKIEKVYVFTDALALQTWMIKDILVGQKSSRFLVTLVEDISCQHRFPVSMEILDGFRSLTFLEGVKMEAKIPFPDLSREDYAKFYSYMSRNKLRPAEIDIHARCGRKWLKIDGVMGSEYFETIRLSETKTKLTDKYYVSDSDFGVLLMSEHYEPED